MSEQKAVHIEHFKREDQADGCFLCVDEIEDKLQFLNVAGPFGWYHGNKCLECIISLFLLLFFFIPGMVISAFFDIPENSEDTDPLVVNSTLIRFIMLLIAISLYIPYQLYATCLVLLYSILTLPFSSINVFYLIREENDFVFSDY